MGRKRDRSYEQLYGRLLDRSLMMHNNNKKRIRAGLVVLAVLPFVLVMIRALTDSDRVVFLIIWVICMFALSVYLIGVEYIDDSLQKTLREVTNKEADFDELFIDSEQIHERLEERREDVRERIHERKEDIHERIRERRSKPGGSEEENGGEE